MQIDDTTSLIRCRTCGVDKSVDAYRIASSKGNAYRRADCKPCEVAIARRWQVAHPDKHRQIDRDWHLANPERAQELSRRWRREHPEKAGVSRRRWSASNPERLRLMKRAGLKVYRAIKAGQLVRASICDQCETSERKIEAAHLDYSKPLLVIWLCRPCHALFDIRDPKSVIALPE